jgi:hypothetical protein
VCDASAYQPEAPAARLPAGALALSDLLDQKKPAGGTPTLPAIKGAIAAARARQEQNPKIKTIVLLATDGFPTHCDPVLLSPYEKTSAGVPKVAQEAEAGRQQGVQTFVIGVLAPLEAAVGKKNLDTIAKAGGDASAYIVTTDQSVTDEFLASLNAIRNGAAACDYVLPRPGGVPLEAKGMKVRIAGASGSHWLDPRASIAKCDPDEGGFVFDKDPYGPEPPSRIQLCPSSCASIAGDPTATVEVVVDCPR